MQSLEIWLLHEHLPWIKWQTLTHHEAIHQIALLSIAKTSHLVY